MKTVKKKSIKKDVVESDVINVTTKKKRKPSKITTKADIDSPISDEVASVDAKRKTRKSRKKLVMSDNHSADEVKSTNDSHDLKNKLEVSEKPVKKGKKMIVLSTINDISEVAKLHEKWQEYLSSPLIVIDASAVERMDTAVLQLLTTLVKSADENQVNVEWQGVTEPLKHAVKLLGLNGPLKLH